VKPAIEKKSSDFFLCYNLFHNLRKYFLTLTGLASVMNDIHLVARAKLGAYNGVKAI